jgi:hypothetical protein
VTRVTLFALAAGSASAWGLIGTVIYFAATLR